MSIKNVIYCDKSSFEGCFQICADADTGTVFIILQLVLFKNKAQVTTKIKDEGKQHESEYFLDFLVLDKNR